MQREYDGFGQERNERADRADSSHQQHRHPYSLRHRVRRWTDRQCDAHLHDPGQQVDEDQVERADS